MADKVPEFLNSLPDLSNSDRDQILRLLAELRSPIVTNPAINKPTLRAIEAHHLQKQSLTVRVLRSYIAYAQLRASNDTTLTQILKKQVQQELPAFKESPVYAQILKMLR